MRSIGRVLAVTTLIVMALTGSVQANPVGGQVDSSVAEGMTVELYIDGNPDEYVTTVVMNWETPPLDVYQFNDISRLLALAGLTGQPYNATIVMRCSGVSCNPNGDLLDPYTNALRNTTPTTAHVSGIDNSATWFASIMELESCVAEETFSKPLYEGWNLISLPLDPEDNSAASAVLSTVSYDAVYRYNATSKQFESADVMDTGTGYFVHAAADCTWEYSGTSYTSIGTELKQGLNMIGWLNCPKDIGEALSSISGDCYYVARWNAAAQKFEVYNPAAPLAFNDFTTMNQGTGYFISARQDCTLSESC